MNPPQGTPKIRIISVTIATLGTTGNTAHNMGKTPNIIGRPNPNQLDGLDAICSVDGTNVTITCQQPVTTQTIFTQAIN